MRNYAFFLAATVLSFLLTPVAIAVARRIGAVDKPDPRKVHRAPVPRLGGLAIFGTVMLVLGAAIGVAPEIWEDGPWPNVLVGGLVIYLLGFTDDVGGLGPLSKLIVQFMAAFVAVSSGLQLSGVAMPGIGFVTFGWWGIPLSMVWIVGMTNAFNLIDGLDGLAGGLALIAALALFALNGSLEPPAAQLTMILAGSLAGFLRWNFNPARIFMGDSGSLFVGYMLACLAIETSATKHSVSFAVPLLVMAVPLFDTITAMGRRYLGAVWAAGKFQGRALLKPSVMFQPDRGHIHHRLLDSGLTHRQVVGLLYLVAALFAVMAFLARTESAEIAWSAALGGAGLFLLLRIISSKAAD